MQKEREKKSEFNFNLNFFRKRKKKKITNLGKIVFTKEKTHAKNMKKRPIWQIRS